MSDCQPGILIYAGLKKVQLKKKLVIDKTAARQMQEAADKWFNPWIKQAVEEDRLSIPPLPIRTGRYFGVLSDFPASERPVIRIQRRIREVMARNRVRREFIKTFVKKYDDYSGGWYYENTNTGSTSWERPVFIRHLFPDSKF